jgi:hypothetical protein
VSRRPKCRRRAEAPMFSPPQEVHKRSASRASWPPRRGRRAISVAFQALADLVAATSTSRRRPPASPGDACGRALRRSSSVSASQRPFVQGHQVGQARSETGRGDGLREQLKAIQKGGRRRREGRRGPERA